MEAAHGISWDHRTASGRLAFTVCRAKAGITIRVSRVCALVLLHVTTAVQSSVQVEEVGVVVDLEAASALGDCRRRDMSKGTSEGLEVGTVGARCCSRSRGRGRDRTRLNEVGRGCRWGFSDRHSDCRSAFGRSRGRVSSCSGLGGGGVGGLVSATSYGL